MEFRHYADQDQPSKIHVLYVLIYRVGTGRREICL
jgi:hypothetical protein